MQSGIVPAIISFILPGIGQAVTDGKDTKKWVIVFVAVWIIEVILTYLLGFNISMIISVIISLLFAYDAYASVIDIDSIF